MKAKLLVLIAFSAIIGIVFLMDTADRTVRKELEAAYDRLGKALQAKDLQAMGADDTPDWMSAMPGERPLTRQQVQALMARYLATVVSFDESTTRIERLTVQGDQALAVVKVQDTTTEVDPSGAFGPKGATHKMIATSTGQDTWIKTPQGWKRKSHVALTPTELTVDGKPFNPPAMPR